MRVLLLSVVLVFFSCSQGLAAEAPVQKPRIAIIIDDIGNNRTDLDAALLPGNLTFAVLPFTPYSRAFALRAHHQQKEIILHAPMQALNGNRLGPGGLTSLMSAAEVKLALQRSLDAVPHVVGVNNHMGSYFTQLPQPMRAVMETLQHRRLYFIDSRTSEFSIAETTAAEYGVPVAHRHVFLDNQTDDYYLQQQWHQLIRQARRQGQAIGIGHPYPQTLAFLKRQLPKLAQQNIELVFASQLTKQDKPDLTGTLLQISQ
ncbi:divergent polysaccharide deacetylase family protein [Idiomarina seosinensis]|uniref:divergent polysaccharide deacetylase family protein n=1 Tax=Idiomarina seosinensis TaxID=281739 RepID=UPI00384A4F46